jgi:seryl-tRNA synthetase
MAEVSVIKQELDSCETRLAILRQEMDDFLARLPNLPHESVPEGHGADDNVTVREGGVKPVLYDGAKPHWELTTQYDIVDFEVGVKVTGAGFPFYKGKGAKLQRALISFFLDNAIEAGYVEVQPPLLVNEATCYGTAQLPDKDGQMYYAPADDFYLIPTAEVPVTNMYRDVIIPKDEFSIKHCAYSQCFRREAGSYGKDVRGLNRLHQFDKVEIVRIEHPSNSYAVLEDMLLHVEGLLNKLELPYRILRLCGGDMTFASALTYDFEVWSGGQNRWLEVSSVSNFESYQAHRMLCRFKDATGKTQLCHTLNGSAMALPRIVAALLENNQTPDGIKIPAALQPYTGFTVLN